MTNEKVCEAFDAAAAAIHKSMPGCGPSRFGGLELPFSHIARSEAFCHLLYMCEEGKRMLAEDRREKVMRWLGFVQGTLWAMGVTTIAEAKNANKPDEPPPPPSSPSPSVLFSPAVEPIGPGPIERIQFYRPHYGGNMHAMGGCDGCGKAGGECTCGESHPKPLPSGYDEEQFYK